MPLFEIWMEGYAATGESAEAKKIAMVEAPTFREACTIAMSRPPWNDGNYRPASNKYWGCGLFDNEADARKSFG
jgi:hypothetical protein